MYRIANQQDFLSGGLFLLTGASFAIGALVLYPLGSAADPGSGYFAFGLGVLLSILGTFVLIGSLRGTSDSEGAVGAIAWRPLLVILGSVALFGFMLPRFGLLIALPVLILMSSMASEEFRWKATAISAFVLTVACYALFVRGLNLNIPL